MKKVPTLGNPVRLFFQGLEVLCLWLVLPLAPPARALDLYTQVHHYHWEERDQDGRLLLEETGPLLGLGLADSSALTERLAWDSRLDGFLGEVDYDGSTILGAPVRTTTAYYGGQGETALRWNLAGPDFRTGPLGGLATRGWLRRLGNSDRDSNGYDEAWWMVYGRAGWFAAWSPSAGWQINLEAAARLPAYNRARYSLAGPGGEGNVSVEPGREVGYEARAEVRRAAWHVALTYAELRFGESEPEPLPPFEIFQPRSEGRIVSLQAGLSF